MPPRPLLIYDGACRFCRLWIWRWNRATGDRVIYRPYQRVASQFPEIRREHFEEAVQLVLPSGAVESGADAVFHVLEFAPAKRRRVHVLQRLPGFMPIARWVYRFVSRHRALMWRLYRLLRNGRDLAISTASVEKR